MYISVILLIEHISNKLLDRNQDLHNLLPHKYLTDIKVIKFYYNLTNFSSIFQTKFSGLYLAVSAASALELKKTFTDET
jgi:hypothetical protein